MEARLYKIVTEHEWAAAQGAGDVAWSSDDRRDGFMHLSAPDQTLQTARLHFAGRTDLVALEVDAQALGGLVRWELAPKRGEKFPHLYGPLPVGAIRRARRLVAAAGDFRFADGGAP
jgi:uncharacterized protein (DUF952 family)